MTVADGGWVLLALVALLGLAVGSFLNVVVWRVPRGESVVRPPSACPSCGHPIRRRDNVPVYSWLALHGRCRDCGAAISRRYPLVEGGTAAALVVVALRFGPSGAGLLFAYLAAIGIALALIDIDVRRLPDAIVLPSYPVVAALVVLASWGTGDWGALLRAGIGALAATTGYFVLRVAYPAGMGLGDVKLAGLLGAGLAWLGWGPYAVGLFAAFLVGGVVSLVLMATGRVTRRTAIPFGPWMILGAALGVAVGEPLWTAYLGLMA